MRNFLILIVLCCFFSLQAHAQSMTSERLKELITEVSDTLQNVGNAFQFEYRSKILICIHDEGANRMRIISPIIERSKIGEEELLNALVANFHSALDVKYALSDEIIWSVYTHPLKELTDYQLLDAIKQVYAAAITFGSTYSSSPLVFPGNTNKEEKTKKIIQKS